MKLVIMSSLFLLALSTTCTFCMAQDPVMAIHGKLDMEKGIFSATAETSRLLSLEELVVSGISISDVKINGRPVPFSVEDGHLTLEKGLEWNQSDRIIITFKKIFRTDRAKTVRREFTGGNFSGADFVILMSGWCPVLRRPAYYDLQVRIPRGLTAISEADEVTRSRDGSWESFHFGFEHPRESVSLVAGNFHVSKRQVDGVTVSTYFLGKDDELADRFLERAGRLIRLFSSRISPYPFKRFCIVENLLPSGLSFPTYTLIGKQILRMPFVMETSLGHEILHSWFGNSVYVDYTGGNWCEGLTAYLADHYFKEIKGQGAEYRHQILSDYKSYVHEQNAFSLNSFKTRTDRASRAIGYGKASMTFHMLRRLVGEEAFFKAVSDFSLTYRFKTASWQDLELSFSRYHGSSLHDFFSQWLERKDIPRIEVASAEAEQEGPKGFLLRLKIRQKNLVPYSLDLPVTIFTPGKELKKLLAVRAGEETITIPLEERPVSALLDERYDVMRDLDLDEFPPSLARLFGSEKKSIILPAEDEMDTYLALISFLKSRGFETIPRDQLRHSMFKTGSFAVLGKASGKLARLGPEIKEPAEGMVVAVRNNPFNPEQVTCTIKVSSPGECTPAMFKLPHYGKYAFLKFKGGKIMEKRQADYEKGIKVDIKRPLCGISSSAIKGASDIIDSLSDARVTYLGERHDRQGIHEAQLRVLRALASKGQVAVAMEMFQRPFQEFIDAYLAGKISERDFLKKTEYFKRWGFNYHFYRPMVEFCKEHHIPVIAMNLPKELSKKIARSGMGSLDKVEKRELPRELDLGNRLYRQMLRKIYQGHESDNLQDFDNFFQAQIAWDETMAKSIADFLLKHPAKKMLVIVGGGHVAYGYGIPSRVERRIKGIEQNIVLFPQGEQIDPLEADFFLFAPEKEEPFVAKLGVMLSGEKKLHVENVVPGSPAALGGIKKGDIIRSIEGHGLEDIYDLKLELFFLKKGQKARITVLRTDENGIASEKEIVTGPLVPFQWKASGFHFPGKR